MAFEMTAADYAEYIKKAYALIHENGDYVTELDLATGDGDHWSNINMGFEKLVENSEKLAGAYLAAAKSVKGKEVLGKQELCDVLEAMLNAIVSRGQAQEGFKTMIDSLAPAVKEYKKCLEEDADDKTLCERVKKAAVDGAENTKNMMEILRAYE